MGDPAKKMSEEEVADKFAKLLVQLEPWFEKDGLKTMAEKVGALEKIAKGVEGFDLKSLHDSVEKLKAKQEAIAESLRSPSKGFGLPGLERKKFSLLKCMVAKRVGWKEADAEEERDMLKAVWAKHGDKILSMKGQSIGDDTFGGNFVPDQLIADPIAAIYTASVFINLTGEGVQRVSLLDGLTGGNVRIPRFDGGLVASYIGEGQNAVESSAKMGDVTLNPRKLMVFAKMTREMQQLASFGFEAMFQRDFVRAAAKKIDWSVPYAKGGDNQPRGILMTDGIRIYSIQSGKSGILGKDSLSGAQFQADWTGGEATFDHLDNMNTALAADDITLDGSDATISHTNYFTRLRQLKVDNYSGQAGVNAPYLVGLPMLTDDKLAAVIGKFGKSNQFPIANKPGASIGAPSASGTSKYGDIIKGNLSTVVFARWGGIEIEDDMGRGTGFQNDTTLMKLRILLDIAVRQPRELIVCPDAKMQN